MGRAGNSLIKGVEVQEIIDTLDSFHALSWVVTLFSLGMKNRLEGEAVFLLSKELEDKAQESMKHAKKLAEDRKSTRLNSSHANISYAVFCLKKKNNHRW